MKQETKSTSGFTLVEVLVSTTIFMFAVAAIMTALVLTQRLVYSHSQTVLFGNRVRTNYERVLSQLRNATELIDTSPTQISFKYRDLTGQLRNARYQFSGDKLYRQDVADGAGFAPPTPDDAIFERVQSVQFIYAKKNGAVTTTKSDITAATLILTPAARRKPLLGKDELTISATVQFRNRTATSI